MIVDTFDSSHILTLTERVTKEWAKQRKAEERGTRTRAQRAEMYKTHRVSFTDVADELIPAAYAHASGDGALSASKRQVYYSCRDFFAERCGRTLDADYFSNTLLVQYMNGHPETEAWKITADARGTLGIPNVGYDVKIPCGTLQIEQYMKDAASSFDPYEIDDFAVQWPSRAPGVRFQGILFIEKEGFGPVLQEARIAERFDLAILSTKGQSVVAARKLVDEMCGVNGGVPLLVVTDFDKSGFEIAQRLTSVSERAVENNRVAYQFKNIINVKYLGLRLVDAMRYGLASEKVEFKGGFASDSICTTEERAFLKSGRRIELNAFTSPLFIEWLESKIVEHLPQRLIPSEQTLEAAYRRGLVTARVSLAVEKVSQQAKAEAMQAKIPKGIRKMIKKAQAESPEKAWDVLLHEILKQALDD